MTDRFDAVPPDIALDRPSFGDMGALPKYLERQRDTLQDSLRALAYLTPQVAEAEPDPRLHGMVRFAKSPWSPNGLSGVWVWWDALAGRWQQLAGGYRTAKVKNADTTTDLNISWPGREVPLINATQDVFDGEVFEQANDGIRTLVAGRFRLTASLYLASDGTVNNGLVGARFRINGAGTGAIATGYIAGYTGAHETQILLTDIRDLAADDLVEIQVFALGAGGVVTMKDPDSSYLSLEMWA